MPGDLAERLIAASELHGDFVLSSGRRSNVYFDKFRFLTDPDLLRDTARAVASLLPEGISHLAAPEGAATLLVAALALETGLPIAVVRREPKAYGTMSQLEGHAPAGAEVALVEDVSTTAFTQYPASRRCSAPPRSIAKMMMPIWHPSASSVLAARRTW